MRKALIVGINKYKNPGSNLRGCVPDALNMRKLLMSKFKFNADNIRLLLDARATQANILSRLDWLIGTAKRGDIIVFHYSGHGSQVRDRNGDELNDHMDEIICPHDMNWSNPLSDDILKKKFSKLPKGVNMYLIFDCCHSGTINRGNPGHDQLEGENYRKSRFIPPPLDIYYRGEGRDLHAKKVGLKNQKELSWFCKSARDLCRAVRPNRPPTKPNKPHLPNQRHIMISGCRDDQTSADAYIAGGYAGALSWHLIDMLSKYPNMSIGELQSKVRQEIFRKGFTQDSQIWGPAELKKLPFCS